MLVACVVHRRLGWSAFLDTLTHAARTTGAILFMIAAAFGWLLAYLEVPAAAAEAMRAIAHSKLAILLLIMVLLLLLGTFMDLAPMILICTPIVLPVAKAYGIDPLQFGVVLILAGGIGLVTPPVGSVLFVGTTIGRISVGEALKTIWPFWLAAFAVLLAVAFVPALLLWLPIA